MDKKITIRLSRAQLQVIKREAKKRKISQSELLRSVVEASL